MWGQYGDIMLVHGDNLISQTIQELTHSFFSHAAIVTEPGKIAEMNRFGFQHYDNHYRQGPRPFVIYRHRLLLPGSFKTPYYIGRMRVCIQDFVNNPPAYDFFKILDLALKFILTRDDLIRDGEPHIPVSLLMAAGERLICSALVDTVYYQAGIDLFPGRGSKDITPAELASLAEGKNPQLYMVYKSPGA
ncbi:MAG: hypothetical protein JL50_05535 [Peptococcaceae bacterium BICA1-7]|nr:MAG: hypothetical protein JL50_05535 [Peptococcaceae bacterium BICA1-7]HBV96073.1 hypothetical protein [Desulfotomaculum sp.]